MVELLTPKQKSAIERAKRNPDLQGFLFRKATGVQWFNAFKEAGFLLPTEMPQLIFPRNSRHLERRKSII